MSEDGRCSHCGMRLLDGEMHEEHSLTEDGLLLVRCRLVNSSRMMIVVTATDYRPPSRISWKPF